MGVMVGTNKPKFQYGSLKVKKIYKGTTQIYSSGNICTYVVDSGISYQEEVEEGASCLSPTSFTPAKSGWTFVGWRSDATANASVYSSLVMGDAPITLYAVFKQVITLSTVANGTTSNQSKDRIYNNGNVANPSFTVSNPSKSGASFLGWSASSSSTSISNSSISNLTLTASTTRWAVFKYANAGPYAIGQTLVTVGHNTGNPDPNKVAIERIPAMNTNIYGSASFYTPKGTTISGIGIDSGWGERRANAFYAIGNTNSTILATASQGYDTNWNGRTVTLNVPANGNQTVYICLSSSGTTGRLSYAQAFVGLWSGDGVYTGDVTFIGRTVVG